MYVKLTRKYNGGFVWINSGCIVVVESSKDGGSVVVPLGDDIDYDVVESPDVIMSLLGCEVKAATPSETKKREKSWPRRRDPDGRGKLRGKNVVNPSIQSKDRLENEKVLV